MIILRNKSFSIWGGDSIDDVINSKARHRVAKELSEDRKFINKYFLKDNQQKIKDPKERLKQRNKSYDIEKDYVKKRLKEEKESLRKVYDRLGNIKKARFKKTASKCGIGALSAGLGLTAAYGVNSLMD